MAAEFIDILKEPELDIGHSKKVLFTSDQFHTWVHGDYPEPRDRCTSIPRISNSIASEANAPFIFPTRRRARSIPACS